MIFNKGGGESFPALLLILERKSLVFIIKFEGFPRGSDGKEPASNVGDPGSISGLGKCLGEGNGYPLQYSCLANSMHKEAWQATVHGVAKSQT